jgi:predicted Zn-dependent protease
MIMARAGSGMPRGLPDCLKKRRLLHEKAVRPEVCRQLAEKFFALGWWEDALEFFRKAQAQDGLDKLKAQALASGDAHLLARLGEQDPEVWRRLAETASAQGKEYFARKARLAAGEGEPAAPSAAAGGRQDRTGQE